MPRCNITHQGCDGLRLESVHFQPLQIAEGSIRQGSRAVSDFPIEVYWIFRLYNHGVLDKQAKMGYHLLLSQDKPSMQS